MKKFIPFIVICLFVFIFFWQFIAKGLVAIPADSLVSLYHPFRDYFANEYQRGYPFKNFLITDPVLQQYPWRSLAIAELKKTNLPLWNPYSGAGEPLLANIQTAAFYPLNLIFFILPFVKAWMILIILQLLIGAIVMYLFLRNLNLKKESSLFGSLTFVFSGVFMSWLTWNTLLHVVIWLPLMLLSIDRLISSGKIRNFLPWILILAFSLSASFLAGHLQLFFYIFVLCVSYFLLRIWSTERKLLKTIAATVAFLLFASITFVQSSTLIELISLSSRAVDQLNWQTSPGWFIPWQNLIQFIAPDFFGNPATMNYSGIWNYAELNGYIGISTLMFAIFAAFSKKNKTVIFAICALVIGLILSLPTLIAKIPFELKIPLISSSQPTRLLVIVDFSLALLAAFGVDQFLKKEKLKNLFIVVISFCLLISGVWIYIFLNKSNSAFLIVSQRNFYLPTLITLVLLVVAFVSWRLAKVNKLIITAFYLILLLTVFDLMRYGLKFNPFVSEKLLFPKTKIISFLEDKSIEYPWRYLGVDYVENQKRILPPNISSFYKIYALDSYNPLLLQNYQDIMAVSEWGFKDVSKFSFNRTIIPNNFRSQLIDFLGVKYIITLNDNKSDKLKFLFKEGESWVYENSKAFPRAFMAYSVLQAKSNQDEIKMLQKPGIDLRKNVIVSKQINFKSSNEDQRNSVKILKYSENTINLKVETTREGILVLTDNYYPGWKARIDGKESEILRVNHSFRGLVIPKGAHLILFEFKYL